MALNTAETTASADRVPKPDGETFEDLSRCAHGTGPAYRPGAGCAPAGAAARSVAGWVRGSRDVAAPGRSGPRRPGRAGRLPRPGPRRGDRRTGLAGRV